MPTQGAIDQDELERVEVQRKQDEATNNVIEKPQSDEDKSADEVPVYATGMRLVVIMCSIFLATLVAAIDLVSSHE